MREALTSVAHAGAVTAGLRLEFGCELNLKPEMTMTEDRMALVELSRSGDTDLVREMLAFSASRLMAMEVETLTGAPAGLRSSERLNHRNGYREAPGTRGRAGSTSPSPSCARAPTSRPSSSRAARSRRRSRR